MTTPKTVKVESERQKETERQKAEIQNQKSMHRKTESGITKNRGRNTETKRMESERHKI